MKSTRFLTLGLSLLAAAFCTAAAADEYPSRPITLIVPQAAGGGSDIVARTVANEVSKIIGQPIVIDNRVGAGGNIGAALASRAKPDGYTLLMNQVSQVINPSLYQNAGYDALKDFTPVAMVATGNMLLAVEASHPAKTLKEFLAYARASKEPLTYASPGNGTINHLATAMFERDAGLKFMHVPYSGAPAASNALLSKQVELSVLAPASSAALINSGKLRGLGLTGTRSASLPQLPAISEELPNYRVIPWYGIFAPAHTPAPVVAKLHQAINKALVQPDLKAKLALQSIDTAPISQEEFAKTVKQDSTRWAELLKVLKVKVE